MAKSTDPKSPALEPGAAAPPENPKPNPTAPAVEGLDPSNLQHPAEPDQAPAGPGPQDPPEPPPASDATPRRYRVNWRFDGFRPEPLMPGDEVTATEAEAGPYAGPGGVLTAL